MNTRPAVFLDRDGVINQTVFYRDAQRAPRSLEEWQWMPHLHATLEELKRRGYLLVVCTNQPDVRRGWQTRAQVDAFHALITRELPVERVYACFHDNQDACDCRKPKPGMLVEASRELGIDLARSFMVGDRQGDIQAGRAAGCKTVHFRHAQSPALAAAADFEIRALPELLPLVPSMVS